MSHIKHKQYQNLVAAILACLFLPALVAGGKSLGTKTVDVDWLITKRDAVTITKVIVAGQEIQPGSATAAHEDKPGTPFQADEDWLKTMSIFITNRTDKVIVCAQVNLWFPDTGDGTAGRPVTVYAVTVGQRPEWAKYYRSGKKMTPDTKTALFLAPGKTLEIKVAEYIDEMQSVVEERLLFSQVTRVNISRSNIYFADGMRWDGAAASYYVPDLSQPGHYTKLDDTYFPGKPE
jgi:hypothetical protein